MTADVDLDTLTRLAQAATQPRGGRPAFNEAANPGVVLALVERIRAAEAAVERVRGLPTWLTESGMDDQTVGFVAANITAMTSGSGLHEPSTDAAIVQRVRALQHGWEVAAKHGLVTEASTVEVFATVAEAMSRAIDGTWDPAREQADLESTDDPNGPQNAASEGDT